MNDRFESIEDFLALNSERKRQKKDFHVALIALYSFNSFGIHTIGSVLRSHGFNVSLMRYSTLFYKVLRFNGSPNRLRMREYRFILENLGYRDIETLPVRTLDVDYARWVSKNLTKEFKSYSPSELKVLSFYLLASMN